MRANIGRKLSDSVSSVGSMILFLLFAVLSLVAVSAAASTYSHISGNVSSTFSSSSAVKYITNKIRSSERVMLSGDGTGIAVYNGRTACVITASSEGITEKTIMADNEVEFSGGELIFAGTSFSASSGDGLYYIEAFSQDGTFGAYCRSKEG